MEKLAAWLNQSERPERYNYPTGCPTLIQLLSAPSYSDTGRKELIEKKYLSLFLSLVFEFTISFSPSQNHNSQPLSDHVDSFAIIPSISTLSTVES